MIFHRLCRQAFINHHNLKSIIKNNYQTIGREMELCEVVHRLKRYAPLSLAETWDNVGLLVEPSTEKHFVKTILLTNDLTESVMEEAIKKRANMIISYHPPIFAPLKSLTRSSWKQRIIVKAIENKIAIYSPHTSFDSVNGGINDWLASGLGEGSVQPLKNSLSEERGTKRCSIFIPKDKALIVEQLTSKIKDVKNVIETEIEQKGNDLYINVNCHSNSLLDIIEVLTSESPELLTRTNIYNMAEIPVKDTGVGRLCTLDERASVEIIIERIKAHLELKNIRFAPGSPELAMTRGNLIKTVALCAGSGGSVLKNVKADMYLTGEMSHHEVLDAVSNGIDVVLCEHSNTERGFFVNKFQNMLYNMLESRVEVLVSHEDSDPITIV